MTAESDRSPIPTITEGVFFTTPPKLPRGPHGLVREEVLAIHRERLMIAFTELLAAHGYANFGVKEIVERGGASRTAFYDCFDSKEACSDAAYERFIAVLLGRVIGSLSNRSDQDVFLVLQAYFAALQTDLVVARAFQVEMDSAGPRARDRRRGALRGLAQVLHAEQRRQALTDPELDPDVSLEAFVGSVYAVRQLASDLLDTQDHPNLEAVVPTLAVWLNNAIRRKIPE